MLQSPRGNNGVTTCLNGGFQEPGNLLAQDLECCLGEIINNLEGLWNKQSSFRDFRVLI